MVAKSFLSLMLIGDRPISYVSFIDFWVSFNESFIDSWVFFTESFCDYEVSTKSM